MAYSTNPNLPRARAIALRLHISEGIPLVVAARKCGIHRTTLWRWKRKWEVLNTHAQRTNDNRPTRCPGATFRQTGMRWVIPTLSARPRHSPNAIVTAIVTRVLQLRQQLKRCAEVIWHYVAVREGLVVSLSSVRRILRRAHCFDGARRPRVRRDNPRRPHVTQPGELVQTDTIHHVDPYSGKRLYYYTVIDLYTRLTHVVVARRILPGLAASAVLAAQDAFGFRIQMVQADNGPEYSRYVEQQLNAAGIATRHSRIHRPNDNAHIERFNRTMQEECIGSYWRRSVPLVRQRETLNAYLDYYNTKRVHLGLQMRTPREMLQRS